MNFKRPGPLRERWKGGFSRPLDYPLYSALLALGGSLSRRTIIEDGAERRGAGRRGEEVPVFFAFQSPGSCFWQIEIARKNLPAGITEGF